MNLEEFGHRRRRVWKNCMIILHLKPWTRSTWSFVRRILNAPAQATEEYLARVDPSRRKAESKMHKGGVCPQAFAADICTQITSLPCSKKSLAPGSVPNRCVVYLDHVGLLSEEGRHFCSPLLLGRRDRKTSWP